jgi:Domain of Unknown Function (DUF928)
MLTRNRLQCIRQTHLLQYRYQLMRQVLLIMQQVLTVTLVSAIAYPELALSYPRSTLFLKDLPAARVTRPQVNRPQPPSTPPPNRTRSGGALGESTVCSNVGKPLIALIPVENPVLTASAHPTLLVYVPYGSSDVSFGEFSVLAGLQETTQLYRTRFTLPATPGIVSISLPNLPAYALQENLFYHWYFKLYCQGNTSTKADLDVDGWMKRVALTAEQEQQINASTPTLWYDTLARSAEQLQTSPQNNEFKDRWHNLLKFINGEELLQAPLVGTVRLIEE